MAGRAHRAGQNMPDYPGRKSIEKALGPVVRPLVRVQAGNNVQRLLGFWMLWNAYGGTKPLIAARVISRASVYRQLNEFTELFGVTPDQWQPVLAFGVRAARIDHLVGGDGVGSDQPSMFEVGE